MGLLPIFKKKMQSGMMVKYRKPDEVTTQDAPQAEEASHLEAAVKELSEHVMSGDHKKAAEAFHKAFKASEMIPHDEVEHSDSEESHTYDAQNIKAAQERED